MPKLNLSTATKLKGLGATGEIVALKGSGFSWAKPSTGYAENGMVFDRSQKLLAPTIPDCQHVLMFFSYTCATLHKGLMMAYESGGSADGFRSDWNSGWRPYTRLPISGTTDYISSTQFTVHALNTDRVHYLWSATIDAADENKAKHRIAASVNNGPWFTVRNVTTASNANSFDYTTRGSGFSFFNHVDALGRGFSGTCWRAAVWAQVGAWSGGFPDVTTSAVQDLFATSSGMVDPAISHAAYGLPLYEPLHTKAGMEAGTNIGTGGAFTSTGVYQDAA